MALRSSLQPLQERLLVYQEIVVIAPIQTGSRVKCGLLRVTPVGKRVDSRWLRLPLFPLRHQLLRPLRMTTH